MNSGFFRQDPAAALNDAIQRGDWPAAEALLRPIVRKDRRNAMTQLQLGTAIARQGRMDEALECFDRAAKINPRMPEIQFERGQALLALDRVEEARGAFERVLKVAPGDPAVLANLAMIAKIEGRLDEAVTAFDKLLANPRLPRQQAVLMHLSLIEALRDTGDFDRMRAEASRLAKRAPDMRSTLISVLSQGARGRLPLRPADI